MRHSRVAAISLITLALGLCLNATILGQAAVKPQMRVSLGLGGFAVADRWVPLLVELQAAPVGSALEIQRSAQATGPALVERIALQGAQKIEIPLYIDAHARNLTVSLVAGNRVLAQQRLSPLSKLFSGHFIICSGLSEREIQAISRILSPDEPIMAVDWTGRPWPSSFLSLDAVSLIVQRGSQTDLNPAQAAARQVWTTLGGKLIEAPQSALLDRREWQDLLRLPPYEKRQQTNIANLLGNDLGRESLPRSPEVYENSLIAQAAWFLLPLLFVCLFKKWLFRLLVPLSALAWVWLAATGTDPNLSWERGASLFSRVVVFPQNSACLVASVAGYPVIKNGELNTLDQSPWGIPLSLSNGLAATHLTPTQPKTQYLQLASPWAYWRLRGSGDSSWHLVAALQAGAADQRAIINQINKRVDLSASTLRWRCRWQGLQLEFSQKDPSGIWQILETPPRELVAHLDWLRMLTRSKAGAAWEIGLGEGTELGLVLGQKTSSPLLWAKWKGGATP